MTPTARVRSRIRKAPAHAWPLIPIALFALIGASDCPLMDSGETDDPGGGGSSASPTVDVEGMWSLTYETQATVTIRTAQGQQESKIVKPGDGPITLLSSTVDLTTFCWRLDVVCPEQVLLPLTAMAQPSASQLLVAYNPKGPLGSLTQQGLVGTLAGAQISIPLGMVPQKTDPCTLGIGSAVHATATPASAEDPKADSMQGQVTLRYSGPCVMLGGNGALYDSDVLELTTRFSGARN